MYRQGRIPRLVGTVAGQETSRRDAPSAHQTDECPELKKENEVSVGTIYRRVREGKSRSEIRTDGIARVPAYSAWREQQANRFHSGEGQNSHAMDDTTREYARLQGCPDYPIQVDRNDALWGFGDAVYVPVISWIAENVLSQLFPLPLESRTAQEAIRN